MKVTKEKTNIIVKIMQLYNFYPTQQQSTFLTVYEWHQSCYCLKVYRIYDRVSSLFNEFDLFSKSIQHIYTCKTTFLKTIGVLVGDMYCFLNTLKMRVFEVVVVIPASVLVSLVQVCGNTYLCQIHVVGTSVR